MSKIYSPKIVTDSLVMCLDPSLNKSYATTDLPVKNGLVMWLDSTDDTTFSYSSGTVVSQWRDKSGLNNHVAQSIVANQPSRNSTKNSRKTVVFDGSNDNLFNSGNVFPSNTTDYTKIAVVYQTSTATTGNIISSKTGTAGGNYAHAFYFSGTNFIRLWHDTDFVISNTALNTNTLGIVSGTYVNSSGSGALYVNGAAAGTGTAANRNIVRDIQIGGIVDCCFFTGEICEVLVFSRVLSATELKQVHTYLGQKWGVSNTDRSIIDLSGFDDNGLFGNGSTSNMPLYDYYNKSFKFYASNKYIKLGNNTNINQFAGDFTVSLWAMATAENSNYGNLIGDYYTAGVQTTNEWQIMMNNSSTFLNVYRHGTGYIINNTSSGFSANTWINVVLTRIGSAITLYANNNIIGTATNSSVFGSATGNVNIGIDGNNVAEPFSGLISNVLIYQKGLSAAEVARNYETQKSRFANTIVQQGLILNLDAGNPYSYAGAGTTWFDVSGNAFNATLINSPTYTTDNGGVLNWASASSQYATVSMNSTLRVANITEEVWVYLSTTADQVFIGSQYGTGSNNSFALWIQSGTFTFGVNTGGNFYYSTSSSASSGIWYHLVHTYNGTTQYLYINGVQTTSNGAASGNISYDLNNTLLAIAADFNGTGYNVGPTVSVNGKMPVVRIYNIALSAAQVLQNYNATKGRFGL